MKKTSKIKNPWQFNPSNADQRASPSVGAGDYYGTGIKQKIGTVRSDSMSSNAAPKQLNKPPKSLA